MNVAEEIFVNTFVQKNRRERALLELGSPSRRKDFLSRLSHGFSNVLDARWLEPLPATASAVEKVLNRLSALGAGSTCHAISSNEDVDGKEVLLEVAVHAVFGYGLPSILICIPDSLAYFEAEQEKGPPPRYLLAKRVRS